MSSLRPALTSRVTGWPSTETEGRSRSAAYSALRFCVTLSLDSNACSIAEVGCRTSRSEENTSELPSIMRTRYAVFCWKTTTHYEYTLTNEHHTHQLLTDYTYKTHTHSTPTPTIAHTDTFR